MSTTGVNGPEPGAEIGQLARPIDLALIHYVCILVECNGTEASSAASP
jgi:hypothetical protein